MSKSKETLRAKIVRRYTSDEIFSDFERGWDEGDRRFSSDFEAHRS